MVTRSIVVDDSRGVKQQGSQDHGGKTRMGAVRQKVPKGVQPASSVAANHQRP